MICLIALIIFSILAICSAKYRGLAKEAFNCVFRRATLRKCETGFDKRMRAKITGKIMRKNLRLAKTINKNFELISWFFTFVLLISLFFSIQGIYNYSVYGNCNGPHSEGFCIFNPLDTEASCGSQHCAEEGCDCGEKETNCTEENNYAACGGDCSCYEEVCG